MTYCRKRLVLGSAVGLGFAFGLLVHLCWALGSAWLGFGFPFGLAFCGLFYVGLIICFWTSGLQFELFVQRCNFLGELLGVRFLGHFDVSGAVDEFVELSMARTRPCRAV